jgi:site-specific DNA-methyltransferase (adenine-specific)
MSLKPYYDEGGVTIYHGDCRDVLPSIEADLLVADPPYGIAWKQHGGGTGSRSKTRGSRRHEGIAGDGDTTVRDEVLAAWGDRPALVFGSFRAPFPLGVKQTLVYRKSPDAGLMGSVTGFRTDAEPIFLLGAWPKVDVHSSSVIESHIGLQRLQADSGHPHAKPLDVLRPLLEAAPSGTVLDPFMGSGSTLLAARQLGRRAIGIEISEEFCQRAVERLGQGELPLNGASDEERPFASVNGGDHAQP